MAPCCTVFVVDGDHAIHQTLLATLSASGLAAEAFASAEQWLAEYQDLQPAGCLVLELSLPGMDGLELQRRLRQLDWGLPLIFLTRWGTIAMAVQAVKAGALTFLEKPADPETLTRWVREALALDRRLREARVHKARLQACIDLLSNREREVLQHVMAGKSSKEIANELYLSDKTIQLHRARIMKKTGAANVAELVSLATAAEIEPVDPPH